MEPTKRFPQQPGCGPVYSKLYHLLTETAETTLSDDQLTAEVGIDCSVGGPGYGFLIRVLKQVEKAGRTWCREYGTGTIRLLKDGEMVLHGGKIRSKAHRVVRRGAIIVSTIKMENLTPVERVNANALSAQLGAMSLMSQTTVTKKLEDRQSERVADVFALMELMGSTTKRLEAPAEGK